MRAFHGDAAIKAKYLARVENHIKLDNLVRGTGWDGSKGCAIGCTLEAYNYSRYPIELGIPEWLARVEDKIFEGMSEQKSRTWPRDFLDAIAPGADLEKAKAPFFIMVLESAIATFDCDKFPLVKSAIENSIALWRRHDIGSNDWASAAEAAAAEAAAAAWAAEAAARAAAEAAAWAAEAAARAAAEAWAAAWAAEAAARAAAEAAAWAEAARAKFDQFADGLLEILRGISHDAGQ